TFTEAGITVIGTIIHNNGTAKSAAWDDENVILTVECYRTVAESLAALHSEWGVSSEIVTASEIMLDYSASEFPPLWGYPGTPPTEFSIIADTDLAMRIVSFLRDDSTHPNLSSITILGKATDIPPSYYFRDSTDIGWGGSQFNAYMPTDFFYSSPDYDWTPNFAVGRLPITDTEAGYDMIEKMRTWHSVALPGVFNRILFAAGNPFDGLFDGEHTVTLICRDGYVANAHIKKLYASRGEYTKSLFDEEFRNVYGIVYIFGHGSGYSVSFDDGTSWTIYDASVLPSRSFGPAFMMGSCLNGIYDGELVDFGGDQFPDVLMASSGGPIAFWGASRTAYGGLDVYLDGPQLLFDEPSTMPLYNFDFIVALAVEHPTNFGEWDNGIKRWFAMSADMGYWLQQRTFLEYNMFGDPVLPLPEYTGAGIPDAWGLDFDDPDMLYDDEIALYMTDGDSIAWQSLADQTVYYSPMRGDPVIGIKPITSLISTTSLSTGEDFTIAPMGGGKFYTVTTEAPCAVESRYYFYATPGKLCAEGYIEDWEHYGIDYVSRDGNDFEQQWLDMKALYITDDPEYLYVGFTTGGVWDDLWWQSRSFTLAIDCENGGYTGTPGETTDPAGTYVCFGETAAPNIIVSTKWAWGRSEFKAYYWADDHWSEFTPAWMCGFTGGYIPTWGSSAFGEFAIPRNHLSDASSVKLIVYSDMTAEDSPAQDCVPSDDAAYTSLTLGAYNANTLTQFYTYHFETEIEDNAKSIPELLSIRIAPNPFNSKCKIELQGVNNEANLQIIDISGKMILSTKIDEEKPEFIWNTEKTQSGLYLIKLCDERRIISTKAILVR
ncbi:hypothetical protein DRQ33_06180, partial [bacterium]